MLFNNIHDAQKYIADNDIQMVDFKMVDIDGRWRHITIPAARFTEDTLVSGIGFDGSNYGFAPVENSDMVFIPDLATAAFDPFSEVPTLTMSGDAMIIARPENKPFDQYPRNVVKRAVEYMREEGIADEMIIGPEFEFHVFDNVEFECRPECVRCEIDTAEAEWNSGVGGDGYEIAHKGGYHIGTPQDRYYDMRSRMCMLMDDWGVKVKYHHHEVGGPGQLEIEVELGDIVSMADNTMVTKYIIRNTAKEEGCTATFLPKPVYNEAGNGMHVHMLLTKDGKPLFYDENGYAQLSELAHWFMGGLLKHAKSLCAITNPSTNSFKRLVPGFEAPVTIGYATANRSAVIRIPAYAKSPMSKRFELRNPDGTCNPYYAYAAILMAGLDGVKNKIDPSANGWGPYDFNLFDLSDEEKAKIDGLPTTLEEALDALEADHDYLTAGGVFPERLLKIWIARKRKEAASVNRVPHPAEFKQYYDL
ncbi:MAG: type I glutamate--ammonia ligase [Ruminococcaceae bacterium]|nr:type I glutamate--ammonia ligase [Oscillospiraceae bacterium]